MRSLIALIIPAILLAVPPTFAHGPGGKGSAAFEAYEKGKMPPAFKGRANPLESSPKTVRAGMKLYEANCVMCHGAEGRGKGHMAAMLEVKPADLRMMFRHFPKIDDYYFWIISQGGADFDVPMPGFAEALSEDDIWRIVTWMQAGFPGAGTEVRDTMHEEHHKPGAHMGIPHHMPNMPRHGMGKQPAK